MKASLHRYGRLLAIGSALLACLCAARAGAQTSLVEQVEVLKDISYAKDVSDVKLDLYLPLPPEARKGAVVWIHGGGWVAGTKADAREVSVSRALAKQGYVVASIDYTLSTRKNPGWPQALLDCKNAIRFLRSHAADYGFNPAHIAVAGASAGAHLALMSAYTSGIAGLEPTGPYPTVGNEVAAVLEFFGTANLCTRQRTEKDGTPTGMPSKGLTSERFTGKPLAEGRDLWEAASPVTYMRAGLPPTFITHGKKDTVVDFLQALELAMALGQKGVPFELVLLEQVGHSYGLSHLGKVPLEKDLTMPVDAFLQNAFRAVTPENN